MAAKCGVWRRSKKPHSKSPAGTPLWQTPWPQSWTGEVVVKRREWYGFFLTLKFPSHPVLLANIAGRKYVLYNISTGSSTWMYILYLIIGTSLYIYGIILSMWTCILCIISRANYNSYRSIVVHTVLSTSREPIFSLWFTPFQTRRCHCPVWSPALPHTDFSSYTHNDSEVPVPPEASTALGQCFCKVLNCQHWKVKSLP